MGKEAPTTTTKVLKLDGLQKGLNIPSSPIVPTLCASVLKHEVQTCISQTQLERSHTLAAKTRTHMMLVV